MVMFITWIVRPIRRFNFYFFMVILKSWSLKLQKFCKIFSTFLWEFHIWVRGYKQIPLQSSQNIFSDSMDFRSFSVFSKDARLCVGKLIGPGAQNISTDSSFWFRVEWTGLFDWPDRMALCGAENHVTPTGLKKHARKNHLIRRLVFTRHTNESTIKW